MYECIRALGEFHLFFKEILGNLSHLSILELCSMLTLVYMVCTLCRWRVRPVCYDILSIWYKQLVSDNTILRYCCFKQVSLEIHYNLFLGKF